MNNPLGLSGGITKQDVGNVVLTKLLQILTVVILKPGAKYESLLPAIVSAIISVVCFAIDNARYRSV